MACLMIGSILFFFLADREARRFLPQRTLFRASSISAMVIAFNPRRAAKRAASLITFASSAPE